ncbi:MAG: amidohydrolase family protein [Ruthenibacterium lactatiformans]
MVYHLCRAAEKLRGSGCAGSRGQRCEKPFGACKRPAGQRPACDRFLFCTDDKHLDDIARDGHLRWNVRQAISLGMKPVTAIKMATWNAAREYGLRDLGAVAAGYRADLVLLDSLKQMTVRAVYKDGRPVEERFEPAPPPRTRCAAAFGTL